MAEVDDLVNTGVQDDQLSEHGEAAGLDIKDHLGVLEAHASGAVVDVVLVHKGPISAEILARYRAGGASPLRLPAEQVEDRLVVRRRLLMDGEKLRHDPGATVAGLIAAWRQLSRGAGGDERREPMPGRA